MSQPRATIRHVAAEAGVSVTTVSHALNGKGKVNADTIARVRATAEKLGYRPSAAAQSLRTGRTGSIALILPRESDEVSSKIVGLEYYMWIAATAASMTFEQNYSLILPPDLKTAGDWARLNPDGALLCDPSDNDRHIDLLESIGIPVVTIERDAGRPDWPYYVAGDNVANTAAVMQHLRDGGAQRIALVMPDWSRAWSDDIGTAYDAWCRDNGQAPIKVGVPVEVEQRDAYQAVCALLDGPQPPDAFYVLAEGYDAGVLRACEERGLGIPADVLVVGGNDGRETRESVPPVSAVDLDAGQQTVAAVEMLIARIERRDVTAPVLLTNALNIRASSQR